MSGTMLFLTTLATKNQVYAVDVGTEQVLAATDLPKPVYATNGYVRFGQFGPTSAYYVWWDDIGNGGNGGTGSVRTLFFNRIDWDGASLTVGPTLTWLENLNDGVSVPSLPLDVWYKRVFDAVVTADGLHLLSLDYTKNPAQNSLLYRLHLWQIDPTTNALIDTGQTFGTVGGTAFGTVYRVICVDNWVLYRHNDVENTYTSVQCTDGVLTGVQRQLSEKWAYSSRFGLVGRNDWVMVCNPADNPYDTENRNQYFFVDRDLTTTNSLYNNTWEGANLDDFDFNPTYKEWYYVTGGMYGAMPAALYQAYVGEASTPGVTRYALRVAPIIFNGRHISWSGTTTDIDIEETYGDNYSDPDYQVLNFLYGGILHMHQATWDAGGLDLQIAGVGGTPVTIDTQYHYGIYDQAVFLGESPNLDGELTENRRKFWRPRPGW